MKNKVYFLLVLVLASFIIFSCNDDEIKEAKMTNVTFEASTIKGLKSDVEPPTDMSTANLVKEMNITAISAAGSPPGINFSYAEYLATPANFGMTVFLGYNTFNAVTTPHPELDYKENHPGENFSNYPDELDGMFGETTTNYMAKVAEYKALKPYLIFKGTKSQTIVEEENDVVHFDMSTQQGRLICSFRFIDDPSELPLLSVYTARISFDYLVDGSTATYTSSRDIQLDTENPQAVVYFSNKYAVDGALPRLTIRIYQTDLMDNVGNDWNQGKVKEYVIHELTNLSPKIAIEAGKDKYVDFGITEEAVITNVNSFNFTWDWTKEDVTINL